MRQFGIGLRKSHFDEISENSEGIDFLEILPENFLKFGGKFIRVLEKTRAQFPFLFHSVSLSVGGPDPLNQELLRDLQEFIRIYEPKWFSDHLCYSSAFGMEYHDLVPLPFTKEAVRRVSERVQQIQEIASVPFLLENPSYYISMPGSEMNEAEFINEIVRNTGCGLLLDINNVFVNSRNHNYNPYTFIDSLKLSSVLQIHMAGHDASSDFLVDDHGNFICKEVFELFSYSLPKLSADVWTLLEWDLNIPDLNTLIQENKKIRSAAECSEYHLPLEFRDPVILAEEADPGWDLRTLQRNFHGMLRGEKEISQLASELGRPFSRTEIYSIFIKNNIKKTLASVYSCFPQLFPETWDEIADAYFLQYPSFHYEINKNVEAFPNFLEELKNKCLYNIDKYHVELANFEWEETMTVLSRTPAEPSRGLILNPSLRICTFRYDIFNFLENLRNGKELPVLKVLPSLQTVFLFRVGDTDICRRLIPNIGELICFKMIYDKIPMEDVCRETTLPVSRINEFLEHCKSVGLILEL